MQLATRNLKLLFIHGWATDSRIWKYQLEEFSNDYEVIAIDLPVHGSNDKWSEPTLKSAVEKVLSTINPTSHIPHLTSCFIGIGWSLGGKVLLEIAANNPCFFKGIILIASSPCFVAKDDFTAGQSRGIAKRMLKDLQNDFTGTIKRFYPLNFVQEEFAAENAQWFVDYYDKKCAAFQHDSIINSLEALFSFDIREKLRDIKGKKGFKAIDNTVMLKSSTLFIIIINKPLRIFSSKLFLHKVQGIKSFYCAGKIILQIL